VTHEHASLHRAWPIRPIRIALTLGTCGLAALAGSCGGTPELKRAVTVAPDDAVAVSYWSGKTGTVLIVRNARAGSRASEAVSGPKEATVSTREVTNEKIQALLDLLASSGFFDLAQRSQGARSNSTLTVDVNGKKQVVGSVHSTAEDAHRWTQCFANFQDVFNLTGEYEVKKLDHAEREKLETQFPTEQGEVLPLPEVKPKKSPDKTVEK
jgi:hypothetical protein